METLTLQIVNKVSELERITALVDDLCERWALSPKTAMHVNLAVEELVTNAIFHGFPDDGEHRIDLAFQNQGDRLSITISDEGLPFNPLAHDDDPGITASAEDRRIGGLGIHFVKTVMDRIDYAYEGGRNVVTLIKHH